MDAFIILKIYNDSSFRSAFRMLQDPNEIDSEV